MAIRVKAIRPASLRKLQAFIRDLPANIKKGGDPAIKDGADMFAEALKEAIYSQEYAGSYVPLSPNYLLRKIAYAKTSDYPAFWMFNEELVNAISVERRSTAEHSGSTNVSYVVGFNSEPHSGSGGYTNSQIAEILEYGQGVPARPVIEPTWEHYKDAIKDHVRSVFADAIRDKY